MAFVQAGSFSMLWVSKAQCYRVVRVLRVGLGFDVQRRCHRNSMCIVKSLDLLGLSVELACQSFAVSRIDFQVWARFCGQDRNQVYWLRVWKCLNWVFPPKSDTFAPLWRYKNYFSCHQICSFALCPSDYSKLPIVLHAFRIQNLPYPDVLNLQSLQVAFLVTSASMMVYELEPVLCSMLPLLLLLLFLLSWIDVCTSLLAIWSAQHRTMLWENAHLLVVFPLVLRSKIAEQSSSCLSY